MGKQEFPELAQDVAVKSTLHCPLREEGEAQVFIASLLLSKYSFKALFEQIYQLQFFCLNQDNHISKFLTASSIFIGDKILSTSAFNNNRRFQRSGDGRQSSLY